MNNIAIAEAPLVPVSWGELIDKVTILEIKESHLPESDALNNVRREIAALVKTAEKAISSRPQLQDLKDELFAINQQLWDIEDAIREKEASKCFDADFIELARSVYKTNDRRAAIKRHINQLLNSSLTEEKSYKPY